MLKKTKLMVLNDVCCMNDKLAEFCNNFKKQVNFHSEYFINNSISSSKCFTFFGNQSDEAYVMPNKNK